MTGWLLGLAAAWSVLRLTGADRPFPWRILTLDAEPPAGSDRPRGRRRLPGRHDGAGSVPRRRRPDPRIAADLLVAIDLLQVAVSAGHSIHTAVSAVGRVGHGPVTAGLREVDAACGRGRPLVDALGGLVGAVGPQVRPLVTVLTATLRSGAPLGPALQRLADGERRRQRRRAETRVRRLPVLLLAPLVGLVLPAFLVLTIVPVAVSTARAGLLPASA